MLNAVLRSSESSLLGTLVLDLTLILCIIKYSTLAYVHLLTSVIVDSVIKKIKA